MKGQSPSEVGRSVIVKAQIAPIILYTSTVISMPEEYDKCLSRLKYKFIGKNSEKGKQGTALQTKETRRFRRPELEGKIG